MLIQTLHGARSLEEILLRLLSRFADITHCGCTSVLGSLALRTYESGQVCHSCQQVSGSHLSVIRPSGATRASRYKPPDSLASSLLVKSALCLLSTSESNYGTNAYQMYS
jgi:hypothetical protein